MLSRTVEFKHISINLCAYMCCKLRVQIKLFMGWLTLIYLYALGFDLICISVSFSFFLFFWVFTHSFRIPFARCQLFVCLVIVDDAVGLSFLSL